MNNEAITKGQQAWDNMADFYEKEAEGFTSQGVVTCATMADIMTSQRTLEVACGPGSHSVMLATNFIPKNS